jgi:hypothetical protein
MGVVEKKFLGFAKRKRQRPAAYMKSLVEAGATQSELAERLGCTRQAVGRLAKKYGVVFPGCEIDIDAVALDVWGEPFSDYVRGSPEERYEDMAEDLGVSLSTFKRRVKTEGLGRRQSAA